MINFLSTGRQESHRLATLQNIHSCLAPKMYITPLPPNTLSTPLPPPSFPPPKPHHLLNLHPLTNHHIPPFAPSKNHHPQYPTPNPIHPSHPLYSLIPAKTHHRRRYKMVKRSYTVNHPSFNILLSIPAPSSDPAIIPRKLSNLYLIICTPETAHSTLLI